MITSPFLNSLTFPVLIPDSDLQNVNPFIKNLFQGIKLPQVPLAGRLKYFLKSWEKSTRDPNILGITQGFQIPINSPKLFVLYFLDLGLLLSSSSTEDDSEPDDEVDDQLDEDVD